MTEDQLDKALELRRDMMRLTSDLRKLQTETIEMTFYDDSKWLSTNTLVCCRKLMIGDAESKLKELQAEFDSL